MSKEKSGIYSITNLVNGKRYIGRSKCIYKRWSRHRATLRNNKDAVNNYLQNAWNKYGEVAFEFEIIEEVVENIEERELYYINEFKTFQKEFGYNIICDSGGYVKYKKSEKDLINLSEESSRERVKVYQIDKLNNVIKIWESLQEIANFYNISYKKARLFLLGEYLWKGKRKVIKYNCFWVTEKDYDKNKNYSDILKFHRKERVISLLVINQDNEIMHKVNSFTELTNILNIPRTNISECISKNIKFKGLTIIKEKDYKPDFDYNKINNISKSISFQNIETQEIKNFTSHKQASKELGFDISHLVRGYKKKKDKVAKITQWRGWKIYKEIV